MAKAIEVLNDLQHSKLNHSLRILFFFEKTTTIPHIHDKISISIQQSSISEDVFPVLGSERTCATVPTFLARSPTLLPLTTFLYMFR